MAQYPKQKDCRQEPLKTENNAGKKQKTSGFTALLENIILKVLPQYEAMIRLAGTSPETATGAPATAAAAQGTRCATCTHGERVSGVLCTHHAQPLQWPPSTTASLSTSQSFVVNQNQTMHTYTQMHAVQFCPCENTEGMKEETCLLR